MVSNLLGHPIKVNSVCDRRYPGLENQAMFYVLRACCAELLWGVVFGSTPREARGTRSRRRPSRFYTWSDTVECQEIVHRGWAGERAFGSFRAA